MMNNEEQMDEDMLLPAVKLDTMVTDDHLAEALEHLRMLSCKSVMAARMVVRLKCGDDVTAADAPKARKNNQRVTVVIMPPKPQTQEDLDTMRMYLSENYKIGGKLETEMKERQQEEEIERRGSDAGYGASPGLPAIEGRRKVAKAVPE